VISPPARQANVAGSHPRDDGRRGFVLVAALLAIVLIAALAVGVLFAVTETTKSGAVAGVRERALIASESALVTAVSTGAAQLPESIGVDGTTSYRVDAEEWEVVVYITRLDSATYWIVADARQPSSANGAAKRAGVFVKTAIREDHSTTIDPISELAWAELF
jgi:type II secretory pathway pseudopilin PulG